MRLFKCSVLAFALLVSFSASAKSVIDVGVNRAELVNLGSPMNEVMIANPEVADVVVHGAQKVSIVGKKIGSTNIRFFDEKANLVNEVDIIVGYDLPAIRRALKKFYPEQSIAVETINNSLAVSGVVPDAQTANRIMQLVYEFVKQDKNEGEEGDQSGQNQGSNRYPGIVNLLTLNSSQQVMLKVKIGEVQRTALKQLGFSLQNLTTIGGQVFSFATDAGKEMYRPDKAFGNYLQTNGRDPFYRGFGSIRRGDFALGGFFDALEQDGLFKLLAEPNLTVVSGENASFLAGGEFPVKSINKDGEVDIEYKPYGVSLSFIPYVLAGNRIRITAAPELSEIATDSGADAPSVTTRRVKTTVELAPGESFMIAGLIRDQVNSDIKEAPGIAEVPIISALMRSTSYQHNETELVISVTPYIVDPIVGNQIRMPSDEFRSPSMMEMMFYGSLSSMSKKSDRVAQTPAVEGPIGFMMD